MAPPQFNAIELMMRQLLSARLAFNVISTAPPSGDPRPFASVIACILSRAPRCKTNSRDKCC
eukprot:7067890-Prymnesium_polylepis.1